MIGTAESGETQPSQTLRRLSGVNEQHPFELGAVYRTEWSNDLIRVIAFDATVVFYDVWRSDIGDWELAARKGNISYYRIFAPFLFASAVYVRTDEYSDAELKRHRPDLPMSFAVVRGVEWTPTPPHAASDIEAMLRTSVDDSVSVHGVLHIPAVYLEPFGPKGSSKPGTLITAQDGSAFTGGELLWRAWQLQAPHLRALGRVKGVGLHRSGTRRGIPSYYIWGSDSRLAVWKPDDLH